MGSFHSLRVYLGNFIICLNRFVEVGGGRGVGEGGGDGRLSVLLVLEFWILYFGLTTCLVIFRDAKLHRNF